MRFLFLFIGMLMMGLSVKADEIKVIVNDTPISTFDVENRAKMIMLQQAGTVGKLTDKLRENALEDLIDERIKLQEIAKQGIQVTADDIQKALNHLEQQNGLPKGGFKEIMAKQGIPYQTLIDQTQANLGWIRILQKSGRMIDVLPAEIKARKDLIRQDLDRDVVSFAEIVLETEEQALAVWQRLQNGADFKTMVELHSIADSRVYGGRVMDADPNYYGPAVAQVFRQMQAGQLSRPIRVTNGFAIILMLNKREAVKGDTIKIWDLMQVIVPKESMSASLLKKQIKGGCPAFRDIVKEDALEGSLQQGQVSPAQLPPDIAPMLKDAAFQKVAGPLETPVGLLFFMKCQEHEKQVMPTDKELAAQIEGEKMELISRQILSELKRDVVIEYK